MLQQTPKELPLPLAHLIRATMAANSQPWRSFAGQRGVSPRPKSGYEWIIIGEEKLVHVLNKQRGISRPLLITSPIMTLAEKPGRKYTGAKLRELRAERGVGKVRR